MYFNYIDDREVSIKYKGWSNSSWPDKVSEICVIFTVNATTFISVIMLMGDWQRLILKNSSAVRINGLIAMYNIRVGTSKIQDGRQAVIW